MKYSKLVFSLVFFSCSCVNGGGNKETKEALNDSNVQQTQVRDIDSNHVDIQTSKPTLNMPIDTSHIERRDVNPEAKGFVLVRNVIPDVIEDVRYYSDYNFVGTRIDGYEEPVVMLTKEAAEALKRVADYLRPQGYILKLYDGYRPKRAVEHFCRWAENVNDTTMKAVFYPDINKSEVFKLGYLAHRSGHTRGSTIDLTLYDTKEQKDVDMGGTFDFFGKVSHTFYDGLTKQQKENRMLLRNAMMKFGFKGMRSEWWHFTLINEPYKNKYFDFPVSTRPVN